MTGQLALMCTMANQTNEDSNQNKRENEMKNEPEEHCEIQLSEEGESQVAVEKLISDCKRFLTFYLCRYFAAGFFFFFVLYIQGLLIILSDSYYVQGTPPLKDRTHELVEPIKWLFSIKVANLMIAFLVFALIVRIAIFFPYILSVQLFIRLLILESILYLNRGIFIILTTVPSPYNNCVPGSYKTHWEVIKAIVLGYAGRRDPCTDVIISGHTMSTVMAAIFLIHHSRRCILNIFIALYTMIAIVFIVASKYHYTIDAGFGAIFALVLYFMYFTIIDQYGIACIRKTTEGIKEERSCGIIHKIICFMENIPERIRLGHQLSQVHASIQKNEIEVKEEDKTQIDTLCQQFGVLDMKDLSEMYRGNKRCNFYYIDLVVAYIKRVRNKNQEISAA